MDGGGGCFAGRVMTLKINTRVELWMVAFWAIVVALAVLFARPAHAQMGNRNVPLGFCQLSITVATGLSSCTITNPSGTIRGIPGGSCYAVIVVETNSVRWRDDGAAPTASVGSLVASGSALSYVATFSSIEFIPTTGTAVLDIAFYSCS